MILYCGLVIPSFFPFSSYYFSNSFFIQTKATLNPKPKATFITPQIFNFYILVPLHPMKPKLKSYYLLWSFWTFGVHTLFVLLVTLDSPQQGGELIKIIKLIFWTNQCLFVITPSQIVEVFVTLLVLLKSPQEGKVHRDGFANFEQIEQKLWNLKWFFVFEN